MSQDIVAELNAGVLTVTLSRPEKKNALTDEMYGVLVDSIERAEMDSAVRVVVLRSEGDLFTAGNDIGDFAAQSEESDESADGDAQAPAAGEDAGGESNVRRFIRALAFSTTPIVAAVQGKAVGIGTTLLLHCDIVLMAEGAQLITPFVNLALVPEAGSSLLLPRLIGHARAFEMFAFARPLGAEEAVAGGVANAVVAQDQLHAEAQRIAEALAAKPAGALTATKRLMRDPELTQAQIETEYIAFDARMASAEAREAFAAFAEKRTPDFTQFA